MKKTHPLRHIMLTGAATVSGTVLLLWAKPTADPSVVRADPPAAATAQTTVVAPLSPRASSNSTGSSSASSSASASSLRSPSASASPSKTAKHKRASPTPSASASHPAAAIPTRTTSAPSALKTTAAAPTTRTVTGTTAQTKYGPVQVRITLTGSRVTGATAVQSPDETARSRNISSTAIPKLNQETLAAQSANIDSVSGASYTSAGYKQSLQSALDKAGV